MNRPLRLLLAILLAGLGGTVVTALVSYAPDQIRGATPAGSNLLGSLGAWTAHHLIGSYGVAAFLVPLLLLGFAYAYARDKELANLPRRLTGAILLLPVLAGLVHLLPGFRLGRQLLVYWDQPQLAGLGGNLGYLLCAPAQLSQVPPVLAGVLVRHLDAGGSALVLALLAAACVMLLQVGFTGLVRRAWRAFVAYTPGEPLPTAPRRRIPTPSPVAVASAAMPKGRTTTALKEISRQIGDDQAPPGDPMDLVERIRERRRAIERQASAARSGHASADAVVGEEPAAAVAPPAHVAPERLSPLVADETISASEPITVSPASAEDAAPTPPAAPVAAPPPRPRPKPRRPAAAESGYHLPPVDLLDDVPGRRDSEHEAEKNATGRTIEEVFSHFDVSVKVVHASRGPVITMYEIQLLDQALRVNKVEGFEKDLSLKLGTEGIRIVAPLPNKKTIGIEVPNKVKEAVVMRDLVEQIDASAMTLPLILGRDVVGNPLVGDLARMPHLLVAGATGTGKSVCMNAMICSILLFRGPDEVKFILVDPKMVELAGYEDIPHLLAPPITDMTKAHAALEWACRTMDERYFALRLVGVRDIKAYNELGEPEIRNRLARKGKTLEDLPGMAVRMHYIVVLVDEYADLMMVNKEVEKSIIRLCQKSRAAGIHVILTTQRPSADVVTGLIKSNLPARICFRVADKSNSRVVLDAGGAENLLGRGDMLYLPPGMNALVRGQGVWVKDKEIEAIIEHAKSQGEPQYDESIGAVGAIAMLGGGGSGGGGSGGSGGEWLADRQFHEAVQAIYRYNRSGADFFRRKLNIGYNKATAYVELLEDLGFLGAQKGTAPRDVLKSWDDWIELLKSQGLSWDEEDELYHNPQSLGTPGGMAGRE